jgi:hypothetical protein
MGKQQLEESFVAETALGVRSWRKRMQQLDEGDHPLDYIMKQKTFRGDVA